MYIRGSGIAGYDVQTAVDAEHHLIFAHEIVMKNNDYNQLYSMANQAREEMGVTELEVIADKGYYKGEEIKACEDTGITAYVAKTWASQNKAKGLYDRSAFRYDPEKNEYHCPAGDTLKWRMTNHERGPNLHRYLISNCQQCHLKSKCTPGVERRVSRWEH